MKRVTLIIAALLTLSLAACTEKENNDNLDPGDLGISTPELWESTVTSLTVHAHVTGSVSDYLKAPRRSRNLVCVHCSDRRPNIRYFAEQSHIPRDSNRFACHRYR